VHAVVGDKKSVPFTSVSRSGEELSGPGTMSLTTCVPASLPSLTHSSAP